MEKVESLSKLAATPTNDPATAKAAPPALPSKLMVTASKKLLDEVGSDKMTFEAFTKAATAEIIRPPAPGEK